MVMVEVEASRGELVAFPDRARRPARMALRADEPRGAILLFTGIRYERLAPSIEPSPVAKQPKAGRPRRRRS